MTYTAYVTAMMGKFGLNAADIEFLLLEADLSGASTVVTVDDKILLKTAVYMQLPRMIAGLMADITEGGYQIRWNIEGLKLWYSTLAAELGLDDLIIVKPTVKDASFRW